MLIRKNNFSPSFSPRRRSPLAKAFRRPRPPPITKLSPRQRTVLYWAMQGKTMEVTGQLMKISTGSVISHIREARAKLRADNTTHAVVRALVVGELKLEEVL